MKKVMRGRMVEKKRAAVILLRGALDQLLRWKRERQGSVPVLERLNLRARGERDGAEHPGDGKQKIGDHREVVKIWERRFSGFSG